MAVPGFPGVPLDGQAANLADAASRRWVARLAAALNNILGGKINVALPVTLAASAATTTVIDARIGAYSALVFSPLTAHAAAEIAAGGFYVSSQQSGEATLTHANNAQTDRQFNLAILG